MFQCVTCNKIYLDENFLSHWNTTEHKLNHKKCKIACIASDTIVSTSIVDKKVENFDEEEKKADDKTVYSKTEPQSAVIAPGENLLESLKLYESTENIVKSTGATSKPPKIEIPINKADTEEKHEKIEYPTSFDNIESDVEKVCKTLGLKDCIYTDQKERTAMCLICNDSLDEPEVNSHLNSKHHNKILKSKRKATYEKNYEKLKSQTTMNKTGNLSPKKPLMRVAEHYFKKEIELQKSRM